ncbi:MAG TPA: hypothetical protein VMH86_08050 [Rhizomicrobium sp.]|nr:hypothetical protein [Rhizomicrobium sp.]
MQRPFACGGWSFDPQSGVVRKNGAEQRLETPVTPTGLLAAAGTFAAIMAVSWTAFFRATKQGA